MGIGLTPSGFADKYLSLRVYIYPPEGSIDNSALAPSGWHTVGCSKYRLGANAYQRLLWDDIKTRMPAMTEITIKTITDEVVTVKMSPNQLWQHFRQSFVGKGSPEQAQIAIQLVYRYHKAKTTLTDFLLKDFIGLDCSGFVGNYYQRVVLGESISWDTQNNYAKYGPNSSMGDLMSSKIGSRTIKDLADLEAGKAYILVMADAKSGLAIEPATTTEEVDGKPVVTSSYGHIMLTQPFTLSFGTDKSFANMLVTEATAAGESKLRKDIKYKIYNQRKIGGNTIWTVNRGNENDKLDVQIAEFPGA